MKPTVSFVHIHTFIYIYIIYYHTIQILFNIVIHFLFLAIYCLCGAIKEYEGNVETDAGYQEYGVALQGCKPLEGAKDKLEILKEYGCFKNGADGTSTKTDPRCNLGYCSTAGTGKCFQSRTKKGGPDKKDRPHIRTAFRYAMLGEAKRF